MNITLYSQYEAKNLMGFRKKLKENQIENEVNQLLKYFAENNIKIVGPMVNTTHSLENINGETFVDYEQIFPIDKKVKESNYITKEIFYITNALHVKFSGDSTALNETYMEINRYMSKYNLQQITSGYNIFTSGIKDLNNLEIDIYIGLNPNKL